MTPLDPYRRAHLHDRLGADPRFEAIASCPINRPSNRTYVVATVEVRRPGNGLRQPKLAEPKSFSLLTSQVPGVARRQSVDVPYIRDQIEQIMLISNIVCL